METIILLIAIRAKGDMLSQWKQAFENIELNDDLNLLFTKIYDFMSESFYGVQSIVLSLYL